MHLSWIADASFCRVIIVTAWTRIHRGDKHEAGWVIQAVFGTRDGDMSIFQRLAKHFEHTSVELRQFIEEKQAVMCQTYFAGLWVSPSANHSYLRDGMMRASERTDSYQRIVFAQFPCYRMNLCGFQTFTQ